MKTYLLEVLAYLQATSTTSRTIGTGSHTFTLAEDTIGAPPGLAIAGTAMVADAGGGNTMTGTVVSFDPATLALVLNITSVAGAGTFGAWTIGGEATLRYCGGVTGYNAPSAPGFYEPRLVQPGRLRRTAFAPGRVGGAVEVGFGEAILANADGQLDILRRYGWGGRTFALLVADDAATAYGSFVTELSGVSDLPAFQWNQVVLRQRDRLEELRRPLQGTKYAGTNSGSPLSGVEGGANDIKGAPKPVTVGTVFDVPAVRVNTDKQIYQVNDGAVQDIPAAYNAAKSLTKGSDYANQADMEANDPGAGNYRVWPAGGMFRIGEAPAGVVSADVVEGATSAARTVAQILKRLAIRTNGIASGDVDSGDVTALDVATSAEIGFYFSEETTILDAMNAAAVGGAAWFGFDRLNKLRMKQLASPSGSPAVVIRRLTASAVSDATTVDLLDKLERVANGDPILSLPVWRVIVDYKKCWAVQPSGFDASVSEARKEFLANDFRSTAAAEDAAVKAKNPNARELRVVTPLIDATAAAALRDFLLALHKSDRDYFRAPVRWEVGAGSLVDLGAVVRLVDTRYGLSAGKLFTVVDIDRDAGGESAVLGLWG